MIYPSVDKLLEKVNSNYELIHIVARRAREMSETGYYQKPLDEYQSKKDIGRALEEIVDDLIIIKKSE